MNRMLKYRHTLSLLRPNPTMPRVAGFEILLLGFRGFLESYTRITLLNQIESCLVRK